EIIPYVPIATTLRTGVSIFSYCGNVTFGITGDFAANPDLDVLAHGIEHGVSELLVAAKRQHRRTAPAASPRTGSPARSSIGRNAEVEAVPQGLAIHGPVRADRDDSGARYLVAPFAVHGEIDALADDVQD